MHGGSDWNQMMNSPTQSYDGVSEPLNVMQESIQTELSGGKKSPHLPYEKRLKKDLLTIAEKKKIKHAKTMTKDALIKALRK